MTSIVTDGLVAEYVGKLAKTGTAPGNNADPTSTWQDLVGAFDGTLQTFAYTSASGWTGSGTAADPYALTLDGSDYVDVGNVASATDKTFTQEIWINVPGAQTASSYPYTEGYSGSTARYSGMNVGTDHILRSRMNDGWTLKSVVNDTQAINDGAWHHFTFTCDGSYMRQYRDGSEVGTAIAPPTETMTLDHAAIGTLWRNAPGFYFLGSIATVRIYGSALSSNEVAQNYAAGVIAASVDVSGTCPLSLLRTSFFPPRGVIVHV